MKILMFSLLILSVLLFGYLQRQSLSMDQPLGQSAETAKDSWTAVFAGGCFWCTEADFEKVPGVIDAISGYTGGKEVNPTYEQVSSHATGHVESVKVSYDPAKVSYDQLIEWFWRHIDPTDAGGQFVDRGDQYRSVIFYADPEQQRIATDSKQKLAASGRFDKPIVTEILPLGTFFPAEEDHQNYYKKNPLRYHWYRFGSGRDRFIEKVWSADELKFESIKREEIGMQKNMGISSAMPAVMKPEALSATAGTMAQDMRQQRIYTIPDAAELRRRLSPLQYKVTRENGTEPAFNNLYWNNHEPGIYVDIISGEPLFSSMDKYESGTGWPSFTRPLAAENIVEKSDDSFFMSRTEVRSKHADSHIGHVFDDGPDPTGLRYCLNSAALRFIPAAALEKEGYGEYRKLFK